MILAIGTVWFWFVIAAACVIMIAAIEFENVGLATISMIVTLATLGYWGDFNVLTYAREHPPWAIGVVAGYFLAGTVWAVCKWWFYVRRKLEKYGEARDIFFRTNDLPSGPVPEEDKVRFRDHLQYHECGVPQVGEEKSRIMTWMAYWPWSMVWTIVNDPIRKIFRHIFKSIQEFLQRISDRVFRDVIKDFE